MSESKPIEERARQYYDSDFELSQTYGWLDRSEVADIVEEAYKAGATEQRTIDIERVKDAFNKTCGWLAVYPWYNGVFEEFVKIIEE